MQTANFFAPGFDEQVEQQNIERQRKMADLLRQQTAQGIGDGRMVGRHYVAPHWLEGVAQMLQAGSARRMDEQAGEKQKQLAEALRTRTQDELGTFTKLLQGEAARDIQPLTPNDDEGNPMPVVHKDAVPGDLNAAYQYAAKAQTPALQQFGVQGALSTAQEKAKLAQAEALRKQYNSILATPGMTAQKALAMGVPEANVKAYYEAPNLGRAKVSWIDDGKGGKVARTEYGDTPTGVAPIENMGDPTKDLVVKDPSTGKMIPNAQLVGIKEKLAKAGASQNKTVVNLPDKKFYEGLGSAVSGQIEKGFEQAQAATQTLNNANQIASGLEKALVGPLANQRVTLAQLGEVLGVTGKDTEEALLNTRNVIQGLARQELAAAGQMKGQGQITESERAILRKAESGDISTFTKPELRLFVGAIRKTARARIATHQRNLENLKADPETGKILPYLQIEAPEDVPFSGQATTPKSAPKGKASVSNW